MFCISEIKESTWPLKIRRILTIIIITYFIITISLNFIRIPVKFADWIVPFKVEEPDYIPFIVDKSYANINFFVFTKMTVVASYRNDNNKLIVNTSNNLGWNNVSDWDEKTNLTNGTPAYFTKMEDGVQLLSWQKDGVEYALSYISSDQVLVKEELIKTADSIP